MNLSCDYRMIYSIYIATIMKYDFKVKRKFMKKNMTK